MTAVTASSVFAECELTPAQFARITGLLYEHAGIRMREGKEGLVRARLAKRLRKLGLPDFDAYLAYVDGEKDRREFAEMIDALTTNKTSFLREASHFDYLRDAVFPRLSGPVRIWSAGCSSGEEPYTLAMLLQEASDKSPMRDARILATDISHRVLATAKAGVYPAEVMSDVPAPWLQRYWSRRTDGARDVFEAGPVLRKLVHFAKLNLMEKWPMQGPFDAILCRNVMIYFDKGTQQQLVERYHALLKPGGHLFVGHSESLTGLTHRFRYVQPAVYVK
jgi:chemotaxis protein methyltransferase CheR